MSKCASTGYLSLESGGTAVCVLATVRPPSDQHQQLSGERRQEAAAVAIAFETSIYHKVT
jgi:hypothetical protein